jgi:hypothetical protein
MAVATILSACPVPAQVPVATEATVADTPAETPCCRVPARTMVEIEIVDTINSRNNSTGQSFAIRLAAPLVIDGRTVAPAGTLGVGEIVHAARARAAGKAGELILAARYLDFGGTRIPLRSFRYGASQGLDNSGAVNTGNLAAAAVLPVASIVGFLIAGGEVNIPAGTTANAQTAAEIRLAPVD